MCGRYVYIFEPIPKQISVVASGATPIGSAGRAPDRKKSTEERWKIEANDKEPTGRQVV
jgi:hypothetical protein